MIDYWRENLDQALDALDEIIGNAYFTPLALGDALAVQLKNPALKGLDLRTVAGVFGLMDRVAQRANSEESDPDKAARDFFVDLKREFPEVSAKWVSPDPGLVVEPVMAFNIALNRAEDIFAEWLAGGPEPPAPGELEKIRDRALAEIVAGFDPREHIDDMVWRKFVREKALADYPLRAAPAVYLDAWAEYVRAVIDLSPRPETRATWPY